ncbi:PAS domain-containing protein [Dongia sp.]|uniref:PAS domain-containing protein n=1 Tax=Dongia sp. TaxID=1977262 RepID=UPI0035ADCFAE
MAELSRLYPRTTDVAEMQARATERTRAFFAYWDMKRGARAMPARRDLDPVEMKAWLPGIQLIDVFDNPRRLVYRLAGQVEVDMRGFNHTGRNVEDAYFAVSRDEALRNYNLVVDGRHMVYDWARYATAGGYRVSQETIFLPLSDDGNHVNMVITFTVVGER